MRKVIYSEYVKHEPNDLVKHPYSELEEQGEAVFHQFGVDFAEFEIGPGSFSTAIIELPDGQVKNIQVEHIRFITDFPYND